MRNNLIDILTCGNSDKTMLLLKLILTPLLLGGVTLAGRKFGPTVSGWLVGLPLTSGPVSFFLALEQGTKFAAHAAQGTLMRRAFFFQFIAILFQQLSYLRVDHSHAIGLVAVAVVILLVIVLSGIEVGERKNFRHDRMFIVA